ncbi:G2/mitotic-specific cyclin-B3 [Paramecium bursaria]
MCLFTIICLEHQNYNKKQSKYYESRLNVIYGTFSTLDLSSIYNYHMQIAIQNQLDTKTIELCVLYIKKYLQTFYLHEEYLQLLGTTALLVATKFNECQSEIAMTLDDCVKLCENKYQLFFFQQMEISILEALEYNANLETMSDYLKDDTFRDLILFVTIDSQFLKETRISLALALKEHKELDPSTRNTSPLVRQISRALNKAANQQISPMRKRIRKQIPLAKVK